MNIEDIVSYHSQLHALTVKRANDIAEYGTDYRLANTERTFKAILDKEGKGAMFDAAAPLQPGQLYESKTGTIIILAAQEYPGTKAATIAGVVGSAQLLQKTATHGPTGAAVILTSTSQVAPILSATGTKADEITVPVRYAGSKGQVLKTSSSLLEVVSARIEGAVAHLKVEAYREPQVKSLHREQPKPSWVTGPAATMPWSSADSYRGY